MRPYQLCILMAVAAAAVIGLVWLTDVPLGVPGEWQWSRVATDTSLSLTVLSLTIAAACYVAFVWLATKRIERCGPTEVAVWLPGLALVAFMWLWTAQEAAPEPYQLSKAGWVLYFRAPSGYFSEAREDPRPLREFLSDYERRMTEGDVLHIGTHPPGLIVVFRGLLALCREFPLLTDLVNATQPHSVRRSLEAITTTQQTQGILVTRAERAVLWLATLLAQLIAALTVVPLYGLLRRSCSPTASWLAASLWPTAPAVAVFLPKSDAIFPCLAALILWLWLSGSERGSWVRCVLAGLVLWLGLSLSLAFLPIVFLAAVATCWSRWQPSPSPVALASRWSLVGSLIAVVAGFSLPCVALHRFADLNLLSVWRLNFHNHAAFYSQYSRTYWKWLLVNPIEFAIAAGAPLACLAVYSAVRHWRSRKLADCGPTVAFLATWGLLWLSGKNMGEAARLWILLTPCLAWIAGKLFDEPAGPQADSSSEFLLDVRSRWLLWSATLVLQLIVCAALVIRVVGFQFA